MSRSKLATAARLVLGLVFGLSGLNHVVGLVPMPAMTGDTVRFWQGLVQTGYFMPLLGVIEMAAALLLASARTVPLGLLVIAPIALNVAAFHARLAPEGLGVAALVIAASIVLARRCWPAFQPLLQARTAVTGKGVRAAELALGLVFFASGVAGLAGHTPPPATPGAATMMAGLAASGYFLPALGSVQIAAGLALCLRRFVSLALVVLAPVVVQIVAYRLYVAAATPGMLLVATAIACVTGALAFAHRDSFVALVASPTPARPQAAQAVTA